MLSPNLSRRWAPLLTLLALGCGRTLMAAPDAGPGSIVLPDAGAPEDAGPGEDAGPPARRPIEIPVRGPGADGCAAEDGPVTVVACGFPPSATPVAVNRDAIYVLTRPAGTSRLYRVDKASGDVTEILRDSFANGRSTQDLLDGFVTSDDWLYYGTAVEFAGGGLSFGIGRLPAAGGAPRVLMEFGTGGFGTTLFADAQYLYFVGDDGGLGSGDSLRRVSLNGGLSQPVANVYGRLVDVRGGYAYYHRGDVLYRVATDAGAEEEVTPLFVYGDGQVHVAVDDDYAYYGEQGEFGGTHQIHRVPLAGGADEVIHSWPDSGGEPGPTRLHMHQGTLYFMQYSLSALRPGGVVEVRPIGFAAEARPVFDDSRLYVGYSRGGFDGPVEGVVVAAPL